MRAFLARERQKPGFPLQFLGPAGPAGFPLQSFAPDGLSLVLNLWHFHTGLFWHKHGIEKSGHFSIPLAPTLKVYAG
jgi:hypothetical protein